MEIPDKPEHHIVHRDGGVLELSFKQLHIVPTLLLLSCPAMIIGGFFVILNAWQPDFDLVLGALGCFTLGVPFTVFLLLFPVATRIRIDSTSQTLTILEFKLMFGRFTTRYHKAFKDVQDILFYLYIVRSGITVARLCIDTFRVVNTRHVHAVALLVKDMDNFIDGRVPFSIALDNRWQHVDRCFTISRRFAEIEPILFSTVLYADNVCIVDKKVVAGITYTCPACQRKYCDECVAGMQSQGNPRCVLCGAPFELPEIHK
nr:hypothetical protein [Candidatus Sigynarchaeota archaeon]